MSGVSIFLIGWGALILGHWAGGKATINAKQVVQMVVALLIVAFLDANAKTEPIAKGLALIFVAAVLLSNGSILASLSKSTGVTK